MRIILVYHDPGLSEGLKIMRELALTISQQVKLKVLTYSIKEIEKKVADIEEDDQVFILIPFRGGHITQIVNYILKKGVTRVYRIPLDFIARRILEKIRDCKTATLIFRKAKRYVEEQEEDINFIKSFLENYLNVKVKLATSCKDQACEGCIIVASFLPSRLTLEALDSGNEVRVSYLLEVLRDDIIAWIKSYSERFNDLQTS